MAENFILVPVQRWRLETIVRSDYTGPCDEHMKQKEQKPLGIIRRDLNAIMSKLKTATLFHAICRAAEYRLISLDGIVSEENLSRLSEEQQKLILRLYPLFDIEDVAVKLNRTVKEVEDQIQGIYAALGVGNPEQLAPYAYYLHTNVALRSSANSAKV